MVTDEKASIGFLSNVSFVTHVKDSVTTKTSGDHSMTQPVTNRPQILFVDDEQTIVLGASELLPLFDIDVHAFTSPVEALQCVKDNTIPLITGAVLDFEMPQLPGLELYKQLNTYIPHLPVIFISGYPPENYSGYTPSATTTFLKKPFHFELLAKTIKQLLLQRLTTL